jgi:cytochrome c551/c552
MKFIAYLVLGMAFIGAAGFHAGLASAATATPAASAKQAASGEIQLPPEVAKLRPSKLPGYAIAMQKCAICHSADYVSYQPPGLSQTQWTAEMAKMQHAYGAPISDDEVKQIGAYLAVAYGSANASDANVLAVSEPVPPAAASTASPSADGRAGGVPVASANAGSAIDVQALLNTNNCLSCHAIAQKIVGPGYQEVAAKYKGDAQALSKLEVSIRNGSVGKWGQAPMPPFPSLTAVQAKALAEFVLKQ